MYCSNCANPVQEQDAFCDRCGEPVQADPAESACDPPQPCYAPAPEASAYRQLPAYAPPPAPEAKDCTGLSDKWMWALAFMPLLTTPLNILLGLVYLDSSLLTRVIPLGLNCLFIYLDTVELNRNRLGVDKWGWLGVLLLPIYLFLRPARTNKRYGPAIVWCVLFFVSMIVSIFFVF